MNKLQTVWLIVRLIGVYFGYWAIVTFLSLVGAIYAFVSTPSANTPNKANTNTNVNRTQGINPTTVNPTSVNPTMTETSKSEADKADKAKSEAMKNIFRELFLTLIYGGIAFYLIRNGKHLFLILNREDLIDESEPSASIPQKKDGTPHINDTPVRKEEVTSLNLTEYIPLSQRIEKTEPKESENPELPEMPNESIADSGTNAEKTSEEINAEQTETVEQPQKVHFEKKSEENESFVNSVEQSEPPILAEIEKPVIEESELLEIAPPINEQPFGQSTPSDIRIDETSDEKNVTD